jgi:hypothetical protein
VKNGVHANVWIEKLRVTTITTNLNSKKLLYEKYCKFTVVNFAMTLNLHVFLTCQNVAIRSTVSKVNNKILPRIAQEIQKPIICRTIKMFKKQKSSC